MRILMMLFLLAGCSHGSNADFASNLNDWVGNTPSVLIEEWGNPNTQSVVDENTQIYTYMLQSDNGTSDPYPTQVAYSAIDGENLGSNPNANPVYYCQVSFIINNGIIASYNFNGDNCVADILPDN